ncbi:redoxin family protein [Taibaiella chishuiensis]|uniref:Redoxin n=1 Tax=Taibaiella chishuiensis TaxID=1434707 RepID=A0A2P8CW68_9BACT|nr:redoxin family protein [Taibaiella chishuiensis]PSK89207.1 redoxin [Taibaiella chishuiensis]
MKKITAFLLSALLVGQAFAQQAKPASLAIGSAFPDIDYTAQDVLHDKQVSHQDLKTDKGLLVIFSCNTCPFVLRNIDRTQSILATAKQKGIGVMILNSNEAQRDDADAADKMVTFGKAQHYPNYCLDNGAVLADAFGASHTPEVYLFDGKTGKLVYKGAMDDNPSEPSAAKVMFLKNAMDNMVAGKKISPDETKSVGCSIKRVKK